MRKPTTIDFETFPIEARPSYPPRPVGVSIKEYGKPTFYLAWGHPSENNCTIEEAKKKLTEYCLNADSLLFHNAKFDIDVLETFFDITLEWREIEDTLILGYLYNPHEDRLGLKPLAQRLLGLAPDERDVVVDWLCVNEPQGALDWLYRTNGMGHLSDKPKSEAYAGAYVAYAPGDIVGAYANGDTERTEALWDFLRGNISERGMDEAYDRERKLLPILLDMERNGIPVDLPKLELDVARYTEVMNKLNAWIIKRLRCFVDINLDSGTQLVDALIAAKVVDLKKLGVTPKSGKPKTDKASLDAAVSDRQLSSVLRYRSQLKTCLSTFMENWLATAKRSNGYIYTYFHQVRGTDANGTKTGRLSSTPNFQNLANEFKPLFAHEIDEDKGLPVAPFELPNLPVIRGYITIPANYVLIDRDFSSQEPRILAHFEDGPMLEQYHNDSWIDFHDMVKVSLRDNYGLDYPRKLVKAVNLGVIYGQGAASLALKHDVDISVTKELKQSILYLYPGIAELYKTMKFRARIDAPFKTWGGREYKCEPPKYVDGKLRTFDYKMVNCLIQGSAADCTKEAIIRFYALTEKQRLRKKNPWFLYLNVHDELVAAVPKEEIHEGHALMKQAMESVEFSLPILTEGTYSFSNWGEMKTYDKKGVIVYAD